MILCTNPTCKESHRPHTHQGSSIDSPVGKAPWPLCAKWRPIEHHASNLIQFGWFSSHSKFQLPWKLDVDALEDHDISSLAKIIAWKFAFSHVIGIPRGGVRLAEACAKYVESGFPTLIVDDVLTTGRSMIKVHDEVGENTTIGVVIFARGPCPNWVWPIFSVNEWAQSRATGLG